MFGSAITFVLKIFGMLLSYITVLIISRKYGASGAGVYTLTLNALISLSIIGALGLDMALLRFVGQYNKTKNGNDKIKNIYKYVFYLALPFSLLLSLLLYFFSETVAENLFKNDIYVQVLRIGAVALPFLTVSIVNIEFIRGLKKLQISEYLRSVNRPLFIIIFLLALSYSDNVVNAIYALIGAIILSMILSFIPIIKFFNKKKESVDVYKSEVKTKDLLKTTFPMMIVLVITSLLGTSSAFFLETYGTSEEVGIFNICFKVAQLISIVLVVVNTISAPKFAELYWNNKRVELQKLLFQSSKLIFIFGSILSVVIILFSGYILSFFGEEFLQGKQILAILVLGLLISSFCGSAGIFMGMTGSEKALRNIISVVFVCTLLCLYKFVPLYGLLGAAIISACSPIILNMSCAFYVYKKSNLITFYMPQFLNNILKSNKS
ncbi:polysaccharide biosynthesis protein [Formosa agariphila KMM 3901]|uniref:Polysaccharide biosynthesis protein n=1 Tax=Formosa agariphila (strain DSM 15362 / KCTC 12365 / LMG 23005 / KMM 3901 / M-2Alg 35-1) TaxID=1347342 RepID=T2KRV4_FORAG|nr:polysaccharide biosynthesis protein [Formosa agariphila KMM 3901]